MRTAITQAPFYLSMGAISAQSLSHLTPFFNRLPDNPYQDGAYRKRSFGAFVLQNGVVHKLPRRAFAQSPDINTFQGGVTRVYEDIEPECYQSEGFAEMMAHYCAQSHLSDGVEIEVHQLRILAQPNGRAEVAPEGVHQDGFNRIGMFMVNYQHIVGGELKIHEAKDAPAFMQMRLNEGEYIVLNDAKFWHDANDITAVHPTEAGYYDLFVLTAHQPE